MKMKLENKNQYVLPSASRMMAHHDYREDWIVRQINEENLKPIYLKNKDPKKGPMFVKKSNDRIKDWARKLKSENYILNRLTDDQRKSNYHFFAPSSFYKTKQFIVGADPDYNYRSKNNNWTDIDNNKITQTKDQRIIPAMPPIINGIIYFPDHPLLEKLVLANWCEGKWVWKLCWTFKFNVSPKFIFGIKKGKKVGFFKTDKSKISIINNKYYQSGLSDKPHPKDKNIFKSLEEDNILEKLIIKSPTPVITAYGCQLFFRNFVKMKMANKPWDVVNLNDIDILKEFKIAEQLAHFLHQNEFKDIR